MEGLYSIGMIFSIAAIIITTIFLVDYPDSHDDLDKIIWIAKINGRQLPKELKITKQET